MLTKTSSVHTPTQACMHTFIYSGYFYSTSSSPLLFRGALDTAWILCRSQYAKVLQAIASEGFAQGPYMAVRAGFEPTTLRAKGTNLPMNQQAPQNAFIN